jgi:hypothetical protein
MTERLSYDAESDEEVMGLRKGLDCISDDAVNAALVLLLNCCLDVLDQW